MRYREIEDHKELVHLLEGEKEISSVAFQSLDFSLVAELASDKVFKDCIFLGCRIPESLHRQISECSLVFPEITVPFNPYVNTLYTHQTLFRGYRLGDPSSYSLTPDKIIYDHFIAHGKGLPISGRRWPGGSMTMPSPMPSTILPSGTMKGGSWRSWAVMGYSGPTRGTGRWP